MLSISVIFAYKRLKDKFRLLTMNQPCFHFIFEKAGVTMKMNLSQLIRSQDKLGTPMLLNRFLMALHIQKGQLSWNNLCTWLGSKTFLKLSASTLISINLKIQSLTTYWAVSRNTFLRWNNGKKCGFKKLGEISSLVNGKRIREI